MELEKLDFDISVCKAATATDICLQTDFLFVGKTDKEISVVCRTEDTPKHTIARDDGWRGFRIRGTLDFSLVGILAKISAILAENDIGIFAVSTYDTDHIFVKKENFSAAIRALSDAGYVFI